MRGLAVHQAETCIVARREPLSRLFCMPPMTRLKFTFNSSLLFALLGPLVAVLMTYVDANAASRVKSNPLEGGGAIMTMAFGYLYGAPRAVLYGALTCLGVLGTLRFWPSLLKDSSHVRRILAAQLSGLTVVLLMNYPTVVFLGVRLFQEGGDAFLTSVARVGFLPLIGWYLIPTLVCATLVGWLLVPRLTR
ncbi:MAG: hypothetical protein EON93_03020 [Burkholderiales bacterium]|nr:MAG: hypothetical protein EON93_03020 [Burkholderiales bacterium]